ncbi:MAG: DUF86 domain-containing protein [Alphaproteobacteria bacterium]|jgi:uncharacterized protein with HEPN domain|nr:DUF86 domain-containing protein [Alphaproteobacteria bacterium]
MPSEDPAVRLGHIIENIARIEEYSTDLTLADFLRDQKTIDAVERCMQRISEAARRLGSGYDAIYPELELPALRKFGSVLRHDYDEILPALIWGFIGDLLPGLEAMARAELAKLED